MISVADELGMGLAGDVDDIEGIFGDILDTVKSVAAPALTFVGGAVGTMIAPGVGTAIGAYVGGKVGSSISSSGGGGGAPAPAPGPSTYGGAGNPYYGVAVAARQLRAGEQASLDHGGPSSHNASIQSPAQKAAMMAAQARVASLRLQSLANTPGKSLSGGAPLSTGAKVAIGVGATAGVGVLGYLAFLALA